MVFGIISLVIIIIVCIFGYKAQQKEIAKKKEAGTYKEKTYTRSVYNMDPKKFEKVKNLKQ